MAFARRDQGKLQFDIGLNVRWLLT